MSVASLAYKTSTRKHVFEFKMEKIINHGLPHIAEQIFDNINTDGLFQLLKVSKTWEVLAENVLLKRWKGKMLKACQQGESKVVQLLLERCNSEESGLNTKDEHGGTSFMWACRNGHKDVVQLLLEHSGRIELNARDNDGWTAFMKACYFGHKDVVQLLLDHSERIDLNARSNNGLTAFIVACRQRRKGIVQLLLYFNPDIDISGFEDLPLEMKEFIELHQEASRELKRFNAIHQVKRRKFS